MPYWSSCQFFVIVAGLPMTGRILPSECVSRPTAEGTLDATNTQSGRNTKTGRNRSPWRTVGVAVDVHAGAVGRSRVCHDSRSGTYSCRARAPTRHVDRIGPGWAIHLG